MDKSDLRSGARRCARLPPGALRSTTRVLAAACRCAAGQGGGLRGEQPSSRSGAFRSLTMPNKENWFCPKPLKEHYDLTHIRRHSARTNIRLIVWARQIFRISDG